MRSRKKILPLGRRGQRQAGFTVVELIFVVALIGIMSAISFGYLRGQLKKMRLRNTASEIAIMLGQAQQLSVKRNQEVRVTPLVDGTDEYLIVEAAGPNGIYEFQRYQMPRSQGGNYLEGPPGAVADSFTFPSGAIVYAPSLGTVKEVGAIRIRDREGVNTPGDNVLEVRLRTTSGKTVIKKWLKVEDRPGADEFYAEVAASPGRKAVWVWY